MWPGQSGPKCGNHVFRKQLLVGLQTDDQTLHRIFSHLQRHTKNKATGICARRLLDVDPKARPELNQLQAIDGPTSRHKPGRFITNFLVVAFD